MSASDALDPEDVDIEHVGDVLGGERLDVADIEMSCVMDDHVVPTGVFEDCRYHLTPRTPETGR
jgi:hypothetical protein